MNTFNKTLLSLGLFAIAAATSINATNSPLDKLLFDAVWRGDVDGARSAIERGANVNASDARGWSPLHRVPYTDVQNAQPYIDLIKLLIDNKADVNATTTPAKFTPLHTAAGNDTLNFPFEDIAGALIKAGADVNAQASEGQTPLMKVFLNLSNNKDTKVKSDKFLKSAKFLVENGADLFTIKNNQGKTPWNYAQEAKGKSAQDLVNPPELRLLKSFFPFKQDDKLTKRKLLLNKILINFLTQLSDKEELTSLTKEQIEKIKKTSGAPLTEVEIGTLISIVQKFLTLLYIGQEGFESELANMKNRLGFSINEALLYDKLFEKTSPLLNLLNEYFQGFSNYGKFYMKKNLKNMAQKPGGKKPLADIDIIFKK